MPMNTGNYGFLRLKDRSLYEGIPGEMKWTMRRSDASYDRGIQIDGEDTFFIGGAAQKTRLLSLSGERPSGSAATGDSHDNIVNITFTNYAPRDTNPKMSNINQQLTNRGSATLGELIGFSNTIRQRGDGGTLRGMECSYANLKLDVGGTVPTAHAWAYRAYFSFHGNAPTDSAAFCAHQGTDGVYTEPLAAFKVLNDGTSSCKGFIYGLDLYDTAQTWKTAPIRLGKVSTEDIVITVGDFTDNADSGFAPGSLGLDTSDGLLFVTDSSGNWQTVDVT